MKTHIAVAVTALLAGVSTGEVSAQFVKEAQTGFRFLENPVSAEVIGRGGVGVATTLTSNAIFWNPALLGWIPGSADASINHTVGIADINYNAFAAAVRVGDVGVLAGSALVMDYGTFYSTIRASNAQGYEDTGEFSPQAYALGIAFSQRVSDRFSYGVHAKYVSQDLGLAWVSTGGTTADPTVHITTRSYARDAWAFDVGAYYDFLYRGVRFGAVLQNISKEIKYEFESFPMPFAVSFGATIDPLSFLSGIDSVHSFILSVESRHPRDFGEKVKFGGEYRLRDMFIVRAGYQMNYDERGWTVGVGVRQAVSGVPLRVDYAYEPFGIFGGVHFISLGAEF